MTDALLANEATLRLSFFLGVFLILALWELVSPRRNRKYSKLFRWSNNFAIVVIGSVVVRFLFPLLAVGMAIVAQEKSWGLLNLLSLPQWVAIVVALLAMDLVIYFQHLLLHAVPALWRMHRMHHADLDFDVTTGFRFHPVEIALSMGIKLMVVLLLGIPAVAVLIFEIILNATALFNHSNIRISKSLDRVLRWFVVTPDMHRVHHSVLTQETNSNFGFNLPWWDRLFKTYRSQPRDGHETMTIGIELFRTRRDLRFDQMLVQPLRKSKGHIGSRANPVNYSESDSGTQSNSKSRSG